MKISKEYRDDLRRATADNPHNLLLMRDVARLLDALDDADAEIEVLTKQLALFKEIETGGEE